MARKAVFHDSGVFDDGGSPLGLASDTDLSDHAADTTSVHGIADTSALETTSGAQAKVDAHTGDTTDAHDASAISFVPYSTIAATDASSSLGAASASSPFVATSTTSEAPGSQSIDNSTVIAASAPIAA